MDTPAVYNPEKAKRRIRELEQAIKESKRFESYWHEDEDGIWCDNCKLVLYYDDNLVKGEMFFKYCPECGSYMTNYKGEV